MRIAVYAKPDNETTNYDYDPQNGEGSMTRFNDRQATRPQSRRTPRSAAGSDHQHCLESHDVALIEDAEWWAEHHNQRAPNHEFLGYWDHHNEQNGEAVFVSNPCLTGRMAALAAEEGAKYQTG